MHEHTHTHTLRQLSVSPDKGIQSNFCHVNLCVDNTKCVRTMAWICAAWVNAQNEQTQAAHWLTVRVPVHSFTRGLTGRNAPPNQNSGASHQSFYSSSNIISSLSRLRQRFSFFFPLFLSLCFPLFASWAGRVGSRGILPLGEAKHAASDRV